MIYCATCQKPFSERSDACPHCGASVGKAVGRADETNAATEREGARLPEIQETPVFDDRELALGGTDGASLELAQDTGDDVVPDRKRPDAGGDFDERDKGAESAVSGGLVDATAQEVASLAQFGVPVDGIVGTMRYGWRVYSRLKQLKKAFEHVSRDRDEAWERLEVAKARLGKSAERCSIDEPAIVRLVRQARGAQEKVAQVDREADRIREEHEQKVAAHEAKEVTIREELAPIEAEEMSAKGDYDTATTDVKRQKARVKRHEIELRNLRQLIAQRQTEYADLARPDVERQRLLKEIAQFDNQQTPVLAALKEAQASLDALQGPWEDARSKLSDIRERLGAKNRELTALNREGKALRHDQEAALAGVAHKAKAEQAVAQQAFAKVGERVYVERLYTRFPAMSKGVEEVRQNTQAYFEAQNRLTLHEKALVAYDADFYARAQLLGKVALAGVGLVLVGVVVAVVL